MLEFIDIVEPEQNNVSNLQLLSGKNVPDVKLFGLISADDFEIITEQWAFSQKNKYHFVKRIGGSGDKGRDIYCYLDELKLNLDIYQCKHYDKKLAPSDIYLEIGKLMHYTSKEEFPVPNNYFIISKKGCGQALTKLIDNPSEFKNKLIKNWDKYCKEGISKNEKIELSVMKNHIEAFDFSIIKEITPLAFLTLFEKTKYYSEWFGLKKFKRDITPPKPAEEIQDSELIYVNKLYKAYGSVRKGIITDRSQLSLRYLNHFDMQRKCFYSAEGLKQFSRDSLASDETFQDLQDQIVDPVKIQILSNSYENGIECLDFSIRLAQTLDIGNNSLKEFLRTTDRIGILHQVANEDNNLNWIEDNE